MSPTEEQAPCPRLTREPAKAAGEADDGAKSPRNQRAGVFHILYTALFCALLATVPYFFDSLTEFRVYRAGERLPFSTIFEFRPPTRPERIAGMQRSQTGTMDDEALLEVALGEGRSPTGDGRPPATTGEAEAAEAAPVSPYAHLRPAPESLAPEDGRIVGPAAAMEHFYEKLLGVAREDEGAMARILVYSESINGSDWVTSALRARLARRFGDGGKGWVPIAPGWSFQRHQDVEWNRPRRFRTTVVNRGNADDGRYGLGGVLARPWNTRSSAEYATVEEGPVGRTVSRFRLFHKAHPRGGRVALLVDGEEQAVIDTRAPEIEDRVAEVRIPEAAHELAVQSLGGDSHLYGVVMENEPPGVVVDGLMLIGAFARILLNFDGAHWATQVEQREADLLVFWLGGNDAASQSVPFRDENFVPPYAEAIRNARAARPETSCLVLSVLDSAQRVHGVVRTPRKVHRVVEAQGEVAREAGCGYLNLFEAMGGSGTIWRWYRSSPRLASADFKHLTQAGSRVVATMIERALLTGWDAYLARGGDTADAGQPSTASPAATARSEERESE